GTADRNRSHWSTSKTPSYTKSVSWQHHQSYQDEIQNRIEKGQELIFVNKENDISFSESILTYYHLFDYAGKTFEIDGQIIDEQTKVFAVPERRCACRTCWKVPARKT
ncbi:hypothetical protein ACWJN7_25615, partial [Escherichia coli]